MIDALLEWKDRLLGRGDASITVPVFDGALKSNNILEEAATFAALEAPEDLATDGRSLFVADGGTVLRYEPGDAPSPARPAGALPPASSTAAPPPSPPSPACATAASPSPSTGASCASSAARTTAAAGTPSAARR